MAESDPNDAGHHYALAMYLFHLWHGEGSVGTTKELL